jgi:hypothetical protein
VQTALKVKAVIASPIPVHWGSEFPSGYRPNGKAPVTQVDVNVPDAFAVYATSVERELRQLLDEVGEAI